jgi:hypothetical protein
MKSGRRLTVMGACLLSLAVVSCGGIVTNAGTPTTTTVTSPTTTQPLATTSTYATWKTNNRRITGAPEADFLGWLRSSGQFDMSDRVHEVGLVEEGLWFCRAMDNGLYADNAFQQRVDQWLEAMSDLVEQQPEQLDKMMDEAITVMDAATHALCPEHGPEFDRWIQSEG